MKFLIIIVTAITLIILLPHIAWSMHPPSADEIARINRVLSLKGKLTAEQIIERAEIKKRLRRARELGNYRMDPYLAKNAIYKAARSYNASKGKASPQEWSKPATPPPAWKGMPTKGDVRVFALLIDFSDYAHTNDSEFVDSALFGEGDPSNFPRESLASYYDRASYGQLDMSQGTTFGWYRPQQPRSGIEETPAGRDALIAEAINYFDEQGYDFSRYDNDGDGTIDYFLVIWSGPDNGWANFWWGYQTSYSDTTFSVDGVQLGKYSWQWEANVKRGETVFEPSTVIHETGHALGLPDYYKYAFTPGPQGGAGGVDIMGSLTLGDHNCFSKWMLDWLTPTIIASGEHVLNLRASNTSQDCVVAWPGIGSSDLFSEFFVFQNRYTGGNDNDSHLFKSWNFDGIFAWHVDATLNEGNYDFAFDNSYTDHKLLRIMEADGAENVEQRGWVMGNEDTYKNGAVLSTYTIPNSLKYSGQASGIVLKVATSPAEIMQTIINIGPQDNLRVSPDTLPLAILDPENISVPIEVEFTVMNVGVESFNWTASSDASWVEFLQKSGTLLGGEELTIVMTTNANVSELQSGENIAPLRFTNTQASPGAFEKFFTLQVNENTPENDLFEQATVIPTSTGTDYVAPLRGGELSGENWIATTELGEPSLGIFTTSGKNIVSNGRTVWWKWTPTETRMSAFHTAGSSFDTVLGIFTGNNLSDLVTIVGNDDGDGWVNLESIVRFPAQRGLDYYVVVDGWNGGRGNIQLKWWNWIEPSVVSSTLPAARSGLINSPLTAFASVINTGQDTLKDCSLSIPEYQSGEFHFQKNDATNQIVGPPDEIFDLGPGEIQNFLISYTPIAVMDSESVGINYKCRFYEGNGYQAHDAPSIPGLNRLIVSAGTDPVPDLIAIAATPTGGGILDIPGTSGVTAFAASAVNIGAAGTITASVGDYDRGLTFSALICQTDANSICLKDPAPQIRFDLAKDEVALMAVFVTGEGDIAFNPAINRLFLNLEQDGVMRGATSIAVRTVSP